MHRPPDRARIMNGLGHATASTVVTPSRSASTALWISAGAAALFAFFLSDAIDGRHGSLFVVGVGAGVVLYHAAFGFTSSWRVFIADGRGAGLRAQMLMLAVTCVVFFPLLSAGQMFGQPLRGSLAPVGVAVVAGAFLFGVGMQLGGGCASGTLYTAGGGNTRMIATLLAFIAGSVAGTAHVPWWSATPAFAPISLAALYGPATGLALSLTLFAAVAALTILIERRRHGRLPEHPHASAPVAGRWLRGPWPLAAGALGLAAVNIATLLLAGRPWGITGAFALWGAKFLDTIGVPVASWPYWAAPGPAAALRSSVLTDITTVMNIGIVLGAFVASMAAAKFAPAWRLSSRSLVAAIIGGFLLGYGARIAYGCNIGAYFSGIASGSLHGWLWFISAFAGNILGVRLRPLCDLAAERSGERHGC